MTIDATIPDPSVDADPPSAAVGWAAIAAWAQDLAGDVAAEQPAQHVAVFIPEPEGDRLRLAAQIWGAGEDTGEVVAGAWLVPVVGSVCGRVLRTGTAALCADVNLDPDYRSFPGGRSRSSLTVPVGPPGAVVAVINVEAPWVSGFSIRDYERITARAADALTTYPQETARGA